MGNGCCRATKDVVLMLSISECEDFIVSPHTKHMC